MNNQGGVSTSNGYRYIDELRISKSLKDKFRVIYIAYYQNFLHGQIKSAPTWFLSGIVKDLPLLFQLNFDSKMNFSALLFGPIPYILNGLPIIGFSLCALLGGLLFYNIELYFIIPLVNIVCAYFLNILLFEQKFLNAPNIIANSSLLNENFDKKFYARQYKKMPIVPIIKLIMITVMIIFSTLQGMKFIENIKVVDYFNKIEKTCETTTSCSLAADTLLSEISYKKPTDVDYYKLGTYYYGARKNIEALNTFLHSKALNPYNVKNYGAISQIYLELGYPAEAISQYTTLLKIKPEYIFLYYYLGRTYYQLGYYQTALECFEQALIKYPNNPVYLEAIAYTKIYLSDKTGAKADITRAISLLEKSGKTKNAEKIRYLKNYLKTL